MAAAFVRGVHAGGALATLKHFPGHGDTAVDTHLGLASIPHTRARLDAVELPPFGTAIAAGADAVMIAHVALPTLDPSGSPATMSAPLVSGLLRRDVGFDGLVFTDSMSMAAIARMASPGEAAVRAVEAGADIVVALARRHGGRGGAEGSRCSGRISMARIDASVERLLTAKARLGLHLSREVKLDDVAAHVGGRQHAAVARAVSERGLTLVRNTTRHIPLGASRSARVLVLSVLDYPGNWRIAAPGRTFIPQLRDRWTDVTAIELSDRSTPAELDLVRASAPAYGAIVVAIYVRAASGSGRLDLAAPVAKLVNDVARLSTCGPSGGGRLLREPVCGRERRRFAVDVADLRLWRPRRDVCRESIGRRDSCGGQAAHRHSRDRGRRRRPGDCEVTVIRSNRTGRFGSVSLHR